MVTLTLDDLLVEDRKIAPFRRSGPTYTAMGRFGNVMLTNGEATFSGEAAVGEVVRLYVVNTANTRIFKFGLRGARMKLVGGDSGRCEHETCVDDVLLAPSERAVLDVLFEKPGEVQLEHRTPDHIYDLGSFSVSGTARGDAAGSFDVLRTDPELTAARQDLQREIERPPDKMLAFWSKMPLLYDDDGTKASVATAYHACPMHPEIAASFTATCPKCGMKLVPAAARDTDADSVRVPDARRDPRVLASDVPTVRDDLGRPRVQSRRPKNPRKHHTPMARATASNGKTTWSRSTARPIPPT